MAAFDGTNILGSWCCRMGSQAIRMLLCHQGVEFEDRKFIMVENEDGGWDKSDWQSVKREMMQEDNVTYPQLPFYVTETFTVTGQLAILDYVADQCGMYDDFSKESKALANMHLQEVMEFQKKIENLVRGGDFEEKLDNFRRVANNQLKKFARALGEKDLIMAGYVSAGDFALAECVYMCRLMDEHILDDYPRLRRHQEVMFQLGGVENADHGLQPCTPNSNWGTEYMSPPIAGGDQWIQLGNWRIGAYNENHFVFTCAPGYSAVIFRGDDGTMHEGPRSDYSLYEEQFGDAGQSRNVAFGGDCIQFGAHWRLGCYNEDHLVLSHDSGLSNMIWRSDGTRHPGPRSDYHLWEKDGTADKEGVTMYGANGCNYVQIGNWRVGDSGNGPHMCITNVDTPMTAVIYKGDEDGPAVHPGPRNDYILVGDGFEQI